MLPSSAGSGGRRRKLNYSYSCTVCAWRGARGYFREVVMFAVFAVQRTLVKGSRGQMYQVEVTGLHPLKCSCPDYEYRREPVGTRCKHLDARAGRKSVGVTRCAVCERLLSPVELDISGDSGSRRCERHPVSTDAGVVSGVG